MRSPRLLAATATLLALTVLAACGDDDNGSDSEAEETETVTETASSEATTDATTSATTESTESTVPPMDPTEGEVTQAQLDAALLTPEEVAPGLVQGTWTDESSPPPCDPTATPADQQVPPTVQGGVQISTADQSALMEEELAIYATEAEASEAFEISSSGLDCSTATLDDGSTVTIGAPTDVTSEVNSASGVGNSTAWEITGDGYTVVLIATVASRLVMANTFYVEDGADTSTLPTPIEVATTAWNKALAN